MELYEVLGLTENDEETAEKEAFAVFFQGGRIRLRFLSLKYWRL